LYRVVPQLTPEDIYWIFVAAFSEMLAAGITTVAEFFYLNGAGNSHAEAAIRAAQDTGIRLVLARTWMDAESAPPQFRESIDQAASRTAELMARYPQIEICVAPHSLHAASPEMIVAAMAFADQHDCLVHIHVAEAEYEGAQTLAAHGATPIVLLDRLGVLNTRIVAIHAIFLTEDEKKLLAASGARVVHNPMTNQYLGDGTCDLSGLHALGVPIGLGTDADVKPSLIEEMRAASLLQKLAHRDGSKLGAAAAYRFGTAEGAAVLGIPAGDFRVGAHADFSVLDVSAIDPWTPLLNGLVYRAESGWIRETYVGGVQVYSTRRSTLAANAAIALGSLARALGLQSI
ncbi:MAG: amidohydrolase family protein, partial [Candidatus Baltobacteraceae bacterium]